MAQYDVQRKAIEQKKSSNSSARTVQLRNNNVGSIIQMAKMNPEMLTQNDVMVLQKTIGNGAVSQLINGEGKMQNETTSPKDEKLDGKGSLQREENNIIRRVETNEDKILVKDKLNTTQKFDEELNTEPVQMKKENNTGLTDNLKAGVESLSGIDMSDVRVHYNSDKPSKVGALAYTQGTDIHVAPGQEKHLHHEAWHVVQQTQRKVKPTMQLNGISVNDDADLEKEADVMGYKLNSIENIENKVNSTLTVSCIRGPVQRKVGFEFESRGTKIIKSNGVPHGEDQEKAKLIDANLFNIESDNGYMEIVTPPFQEPGGMVNLKKTMKAIQKFILYLEEKGKVDTSLQQLIDISNKPGESPIPLKAQLAKKDEDEDIEVDGEWKIKLENDLILAHPQATVGIRLDKVGSLLNMFAAGGAISGKSAIDNKSHSWDTKKEYGAEAQKEYTSEAVSNVNKGWAELVKEYHLSKNFKGFLVIICTYLICADKAETCFEDAKGIAPFMSRVNLADVAKATSKNDQEFMSSQETTELIMKLAKVEVSSLYRKKFSEEGLYTYEDTTKNLPNITNQEWLEKLLCDKVDKLAEFGESISELSDKTTQEKKVRSFGNFDMESATDIGAGRKGIVLEIRRLPRDLPVAEWIRVAEKVYSIVQLLNKSKQ